MEKVLMKGNEAIAEAAIQAGCRHFFGYPITPQTEVAAYMSKRMPKVGGVFLQAESEVASINMVYGAAGAGARVMTSSSSPGISLMSEGISYIAGSDLPCLIVNVVRAGPGLGGIQGTQGDYFQATKGGGHGDYHCVVFAPSTIQEMVDLTAGAFDVGDAYRVPVMLLTDAMLGQMMEPVSFEKKDSRPLAPKDWATNGTKMKREKNIVNSLKIEPPVMEALLAERYGRYDEIVRKETRVEMDGVEDAELVIAAYGTTARIVKSAVLKGRAKGLKLGLIRPITLWPFPTEAFRAARRARAFLSVELCAGQMVEDVRLSVPDGRPVHFFGRNGGMTPTPAEVLAEIEKILGGVK
jgi:2-oxoglutarate ferredoxin oxidoreductase subunit alpha